MQIQKNNFKTSFGIRNIKINHSVKFGLGEEVYNALEKAMPKIYSKGDNQTDITFKKLGAFKSMYEGMYDGIFKGILHPTKELCAVATKTIKVQKKTIFGKIKHVEKKVSVARSSFAEKNDIRHIDLIISELTNKTIKALEDLIKKENNQ